MCYICDHLKKDFLSSPAKFKLDWKLTYDHQSGCVITEAITAMGPCIYCPKCGQKIKDE